MRSVEVCDFAKCTYRELDWFPSHQRATWLLTNDGKKVAAA